jgi:hypothetical protein
VKTKNKTSEISLPKTPTVTPDPSPDETPRRLTPPKEDVSLTTVMAVCEGVESYKELQLSMNAISTLKPCRFPRNIAVFVKA